MTQEECEISLSPHLLWEYDLGTFDYDRSKKMVMERIVARGSLLDWKIMVQMYPTTDILQIVAESKQLTSRDQHFTSIFLDSNLLNAA